MPIDLNVKPGPENLPEHVAIIMDGNGRWAKKQGHNRVFGHKSAISSVRDTIEGAVEIGLKYLTLYAFSTENWKRPKIEVNALMQLLVSTIRKETKTLMENNVRLLTIGEIDKLPSLCKKELSEAISITSTNTGMNLVLALNYGSRADLLNAVRHLLIDYSRQNGSTQEITEHLLKKYMSTASIPDPELLIRTSGEHRISNFLLWEIAYTELYFIEKLWPDFRRQDLFDAIIDFQKRERRFGKTSEQLHPEVAE
jgi:undecaprenyl diphosphate synthase